MPGDFLFFKAKKAQWYHMLDWEMMENTWRMLPAEIKQKVIMDGLYGQGISNQPTQALGATNLSSAPTSPMLEVQQNR
jgi:NAD(P)H-hydrate repair Nnr-like enzyme with NAD(P)H-hydrate epimerase domain